MLFWKRDMQKHADWFDNHEPAQARFEENEEWLEELEDRVDIEDIVMADEVDTVTNAGA